jgi:hypothetical protein
MGKGGEAAPRRLELDDDSFLHLRPGRTERHRHIPLRGAIEKPGTLHPRPGIRYALAVRRRIVIDVPGDREASHGGDRVLDPDMTG